MKMKIMISRFARIVGPNEFGLFGLVCLERTEILIT